MARYNDKWDDVLLWRSSAERYCAILHGCILAELHGAKQVWPRQEPEEEPKPGVWQRLLRRKK